ncbi:hypothetical protein [Luteolibacter marinus]|uniref:hypothetical protein n=1 Tax=Luteolibacter marinus TaxID=2776705 RepID=UPI0018687A02|nr:hypothetical protein [Luteolibacter marinus]
MNPLGFLFFIVTAIALMSVPRRWAPIPLLLGVLYITHGQAFNIGVNLPVFRLLLVVGLFRILVKGEGISGGVNLIDKLMVAFCCWLFLASFFHEKGADGAGPIFITGKIAEIGICYLLVRCFCHDLDDFFSILGVIAFLLVPIAIEMIQEKFTGKNLFSATFGGVVDAVVERDGRLRARGPFRHAILAGTVGAALVPLMIAMWRRDPTAAKIGLLACLTMVATCASSGPVLSLGFGLGAVFLWKFRQFMGWLRWGMVAGYLALEMTMNRPAYYIIGEMSVVGGSTGWHRSHLIDSSIKYFSDWWLFGTDYTRSWMPTGVTWSKDHTDITNYFLAFGVMGGFLAMILMIAMIWVAFKWVGNVIEANPEMEQGDRFMIWCMGASLFSHVGTSVSVAYYDQSYVFFWFSIATISSMHFLMEARPQHETGGQPDPGSPHPGFPSWN